MTALTSRLDKLERQLTSAPDRDRTLGVVRPLAGETPEDAWRRDHADTPVPGTLVVLVSQGAVTNEGATA